jgi:hypothetical protein
MLIHSFFVYVLTFKSLFKLCIFLFPCVFIIFKYYMLEVWNLGLLGYMFVFCVCVCVFCVISNEYVNVVCGCVIVQSLICS